MNKVTFKSLDAQKIHDKLIAVGDRLTVIEKIVDQVLNDTDSSCLLPVIQDAQNELSEVYFDMTEWSGNKLAIINE
jgi:hypothetical protein